MLQRPFGKTGKNVSILSCGGMRFDKPQEIDANAEIVYHAYKAGVNYFDTAPGYCEDKSEAAFGAAIRRMKPGTFYVSTKTFADNESKLRANLEQSLRRLHVQRINFYHIWCITSMDAWKKRQGGVRAALKAKAEGLIEHVCVSSHLAGDELSQILAGGAFEGVMLGYCAINFPYRQAAVATAGKHGMGVITMNPLGGGLIPQNAERFDFLRGPGDADVVAAALRFNLSNPDITSALVGFSSTQQVDQAVAALASFTPYPAAHYAAVQQQIKASFNDLCTGCGYCLPCPKGIEGPKMMDAYNQKVLGGDDAMKITSRLGFHWGVGADTAATCSLCGGCEKRCTQHLPIRKRIKEIAALAKGEATGRRQ